MWATESISDVARSVFSNPEILLGIPLAIAGAAFMSFGTQYQHRGVQKVESLSGRDGGQGLTGNQLMKLLVRPSWIAGTLMLGLAIICQLSALWFAPLIVVQPLGAVALVITTLLNSHITGFKPTRRSLIAIGMCVVGVFLFVGVAAFNAEETPVDDMQLMTVLIILLVVIIVFGAFWMLVRKRAGALFYIMCAGIVYGFVATLAKVVLNRIQSENFDWLTVVCIIALLAGTGVGGYFVQTAHASGPPDLVIAGLTVIDPIVAVLIGLLVLGEAENAAPWVLVSFAIAGAVAAWGVVELARYHPQVVSESQEFDMQRGSGPAEAKPQFAPRTNQAEPLRAPTTPQEPFDDGPIISSEK